MKFLSYSKHFCRNCFIERYKILACMVVLFLSFFYGCVATIKTAPKGVEVSIFDLLECPVQPVGILNIYSLPFVSLIFIVILIKIVDLTNNEYYLVRSKFREDIWERQVIFILLLAFIYSLIVIIGGYLISGITIGSFHNNWTSNTSLIYKAIGENVNWKSKVSLFKDYKILLILYSSLFLGLTLVGSLVCLLKNYLKNIYAFSIIIVLMIIEATINLPIISRKILIDPRGWEKPLIIFINDFYMIFLILIIYFAGKYVVQGKDFLNKRVGG